MSRFDYVKYDEQATNDQAYIKARFEQLESTVSNILHLGRAHSLMMARLEEAYMWCGKAIRDEQIVRNGAADTQEDRSNE